MKFEMQVLNIFRLSNGRTVFGGLVANHPELIRECACELFSEDGVKQHLSLEGEQIVKKVSANDLRALATVEHVMLTEEEAQSGKWRLVCSDVG